jgi:hypothetical protein
VALPTLHQYEEYLDWLELNGVLPVTMNAAQNHGVNHMTREHKCPMCGRSVKRGDNHPLDNLPRNIETGFDKLKCDTKHGQRIGWWYQSDVEYAKECFEEDESWRNNPPYCGMMVAAESTTLRGGFGADIDEDRCVVIMDTYPVEKSYCEATWTMLGWLLDDDEVAEIVALP